MDMYICMRRGELLVNCTETYNSNSVISTLSAVIQILTFFYSLPRPCEVDTPLAQK